MNQPACGFNSHSLAYRGRKAEKAVDSILKLPVALLFRKEQGAVSVCGLGMSGVTPPLWITLSVVAVRLLPQASEMVSTDHICTYTHICKYDIVC